MGTLSVDNIEERSTGKSQNVLSGQAKAFVNYDQTAGPDINASFNISSVTDVTTGQHTLNFTNSFNSSDDHMLSSSMWNTNSGGAGIYAGAGNGPLGCVVRGNVALSASSIAIEQRYGSTAASNGGAAEVDATWHTIHGDLA